MRTLSAGGIGALASSGFALDLFLAAEFDSGALRFWSGPPGAIATLGGEDFTGTGELIGIEGIEETTEVRAAGMSVTVSGIESSVLNLVHSEPYQGRPLTVWARLSDLARQAPLDDILLFRGRMDVMSVSAGASRFSVKIEVENRLVSLDRSAVATYTPADQEKRYPGDKGLEFVPRNKEYPLVWKG